MKILIIGGTGNIGRNIISNINLKEHEVFSISQKKKSKIKKLNLIGLTIIKISQK